MIIEISDKGFLEREIILKLPRKELELAKEKKIIELSKSLNLKGFRKGFVPYNIIISRFEGEINNDVLNDILYKNLIEFIKKNNINFIKFPSLKTSDVTSFDDYFLFVFDLEIYPLINFSFDKMKVIKYKSFINDVDVDSEVDRLRTLYGSWKNVDSVMFEDKISFEIRDPVSAKPVFFEKESIVNKTYCALKGFLDFVVDRKKDVDYFVFFSNNVISESVSSDKSYIFRILDIKRFYISNLDLSFYNTVGFDNTYDFKSFIKTNLNKVQVDVINTLLKRDILSSLIGSHDFDIPNSMLNDKILDFKNKGIIKDKNEVFNDVKIDLLIKEIVKKFNIYVSKDEILKVLQIKHGNQIKFDENFYNYIENDMYIEKVKDVLLTKICVEEKEIKFSELLRMGNNL
ncbi:MAG TPA: trigger factor [Candidatus Azoamicus sp.]